MAPLFPRIYFFEIDDQPWFPAYFRSKVQTALTLVWTNSMPILIPVCPAQHVAQILLAQLSQNIHDYLFIDFCAGAGGPTPSIERFLNKKITGGPSSSIAPRSHANAAVKGAKESSSQLDDASSRPVQFVLTDLHPHIENWARMAALSPNLTYEKRPVDAAHVPQELLRDFKRADKKVFRLFNLAFHHFDNPLARNILSDTVATSEGFGIFELQDRSIAALLNCCVFGIGIIVGAPIYAFLWKQPAILFFSWLIPILPFVLVFDGWISCLRTRTPDEVETLLRTCGAGSEAEIATQWEVRSGRSKFMWPAGYVDWVIGLKK